MNKGNGNQVNQGNSNSTTNGDKGDTVTGLRDIVSETKKEIVGSYKLYNSGNAAAANKGVAKIAATAAQGQNEKEPPIPSVSALLGNVAGSIGKATVSIDKSQVEGFEPSGDMVADFTKLAKYYIEMLSQFTIKNTLKRVLLAIKSEVEKIKIQLEETERLMKSIPKRWQEFKKKFAKNPKKALTPPSKEGQKVNKALTEEQAVKTVLEDQQKNIQKQRNV